MERNETFAVAEDATFEILDRQLVEAVSGGFSLGIKYRRTSSNETCGSEINDRCNKQGMNEGTCFQANPACGADTVCAGGAVPV